MARVHETVYNEVYEVDKTCNMAEFAKQKIPGFRPELGYGYYEFKQEEFLEPEKKVVLIDKVLYSLALLISDDLSVLNLISFAAQKIVYRSWSTILLYRRRLRSRYSKGK